MPFSANTESDRGATGIASLASEHLPPWGAWALDQAGQATSILVCGNGAGTIGEAVLARGLSRTVHVIETDPLMIASGTVERTGLNRWDGVNAFGKAFPDLDGAEDLGVILLSGCSASSGALLKVLNDHLAYVVVAVDFLGPRAARHSVLTPIRLVASLAGFSVVAYQRLDRTECMLFEREFEGGQEGVPATEAMQALVGATDGIARRKLKQMESDARKAGRELKRVRAGNGKLRRQLDELQGGIAYNLSRSVADAFYSPRKLLRLPWSIVEHGRQFLARRRDRMAQERAQASAQALVAEPAAPVKAVRALDDEKKAALKRAVVMAIPDGIDAIVSIADDHVGADAKPPVRALALLVAAQACSSEDRHDLEFDLAQRALHVHRSVGILRGFVHASLRSRKMEAADAALRELVAFSRNGSAAASAFLARFSRSTSYKLVALAEIQPPELQWRWPRSNRLAYVLHNSLPYSSGGYATRGHGVAVGLREVGVDVECITRPGFPLDIKPELVAAEVPAQDVIDGVSYSRTLSPLRAGMTEYDYIMQAASRLEKILVASGAGYVQAASNYVTGLPALIAARRLGLPFFYEVRGLWEITRISREPEFERSVAYGIQRQMESVLAREADHVFTLTQPMLEELVARGVEEQRITLLPNSVDADKFIPRGRDTELARRLGIPDGVPVIGYIGTFVVYEGLEDLAAACVKLHESGQDFRLMLIGNENASGQGRGPISEEILRIADEGGIADKLVMPGRIPHEEVAAYYSLVDVSPFPRKPWPVCEMVSPMKPLEALAMEKAVVVSSVRALTEMIQDGVTGRVFEKGNVDSLFQVLRELIADPEQRERFGVAGREWVRQDRSWVNVATRIVATMRMVEATGPRELPEAALVESKG